MKRHSFGVSTLENVLNDGAAEHVSVHNARLVVHVALLAPWPGFVVCTLNDQLSKYQLVCCIHSQMYADISGDA